jgi:5-(carboxyamino)imidazole ribonucleotide synthase
MTAEAAKPLGIAIYIFEREAGSPAGQVVGTEREIVGDWRDVAARQALTSLVDLITLENEFIDDVALNWFVDHGRPVYPRPATLHRIQDKLRQKQTLASAGLPVAKFQPITTEDDLRATGEILGWPLVLKARRLGYDGHGNVTVNGPDHASAALASLARAGGQRESADQPLEAFAEAFVPFVAELAVMVARDRAGRVATYPVVETIQRDHICHEVIAPARIPDFVAKRVQQIAVAAVEAVDAVGVVGVELFLLADGSVLLNELAPRPHNSGHYTIEGCQTSQFANHLRAVVGVPLGPVGLVAPAAAMVNLLGTRGAVANPGGLAEARAVPDTFLHLYGKRDVRLGRKMGHVTALGDTRERALASAREAAGVIRW